MSDETPEYKELLADLTTAMLEIDRLKQVVEQKQSKIHNLYDSVTDKEERLEILKSSVINLILKLNAE